MLTEGDRALRVADNLVYAGVDLVEPTSDDGWYGPIKTACEMLVAAVLMVVAGPVMAAAMLAVKLTSRGPAIYSQTRLGRFGRTFTIYKIRTMAHNCEATTGPRWSTIGDPRVTPVGRFLRRTHIDELPQLWNIIRGEMSLVGPRPERPEIVPHLESAIDGYRDRLAVRPGVTGLAQVQLPPDTDLGSVRRKLAYDLYYVNRVGPVLDLKILVGTALHVCGVPSRTTRKLLLLPSRESVEHAHGVVAQERADLACVQTA